MLSFQIHIFIYSLTSSTKTLFFLLILLHVLHLAKAFGGTDYTFLSTTTSTPDSIHGVKKDITQQSCQQTSQSSNQQGTPTSSTTIKKKKSMVNLFTCGQPQSSTSPITTNNIAQNQHQQQTQQMTPTQQQQSTISSSICDTTTSISSKRYNAFNNISFDTNLDFLSFVSLYRSFR